MKLEGKRIGDGASCTTTDDGDMLQAFQFTRLTQRTDEIGKLIAFFKTVEFDRGSTDNLENDGDGTIFRVFAGDGERNTFTVFVRSQNDELSRLSLLGDKGCINDQSGDGRIEDILLHNFEHMIFFLQYILHILVDMKLVFHNFLSIF